MSKGKEAMEKLVQRFGGRVVGAGKMPPYDLTAYSIGRSFVVLMENQERRGWDLLMPVSDSLSVNKTIEAATSRITQENK
jgi:hypothetical protein